MSVCFSPCYMHCYDGRWGGVKTVCNAPWFPIWAFRTVWHGRHGMDEANWLQLVALLMVAILVVPAALRRNRGTWLPYAAVWLAVIVALVFVWDSVGPF